MDEAAPTVTNSGSGEQVVEMILEKKVTRKATYYKVYHIIIEIDEHVYTAVISYDEQHSEH
jgi:hypothetical protein